MIEPKVQFCYSKDGGHNWSNWRERSLGAIGRYQQRVRMFRMGRGYQIVFRLRVSDPVKRDILGATATVSVGK